MGTHRGPWLALLALPAVALSGCVLEADGVPVLAPDGPWTVVYRQEGGPMDAPSWTRVAFLGRAPLVQSDGAVREGLVFDVHTENQELSLEPSATPTTMSRFVVDAATGLLAWSAWVCYDPPPGYHCLHNGSSIQGADRIPFLWAASLAWGRSFTRGVPQSFGVHGLALAGWQTESAQVNLTWKKESGGELLVVESTREPHTSMKGLTGDFEGTARFDGGSWFPHTVHVARLGKPGWRSLLTAEVVAQGPSTPPTWPPAPGAVALPPADQEWRGPLAPGLEDMDLAWGGTPRAAWGALEANADFQSWQGQHASTFGRSIPGSTGGGGSGCFLPQQGCPVSSSSERFEFLVGAADGARGLAEVEWSRDEWAGVRVEEGNDATFEPGTPDGPGDPRVGRLFMDGSELPNVACSLDPACQRPLLWRQSIGTEGGLAYFTWAAAPNPHVDPMVIFRLDLPAMPYLVLPNGAAQAFLGPL